MTEAPKRNVAASVRARLLNLSKQRREDFNLTLTRYALERFLYRLGQSHLRERYVLKGAALFALWFEVPHRPTRDLDLLGAGRPDLRQVERDMRDICAEACDDGMVFDIETVQADPIRLDQPYIGARVTLLARLVTARIDLQIDVGYGDAVTPQPVWVDYRTMLDQPAPHVRAYSVYTTVAEKFDALITLGLANTRMKDFYDLWYLSRSVEFDGGTLVEAVCATFDRRHTAVPDGQPVAFTDEFARAPLKESQWRSFLRKSQLSGTPDLPPVLTAISAWLTPVLECAQQRRAFPKTWTPDAGWR